MTSPTDLYLRMMKQLRNDEPENTEIVCVRQGSSASENWRKSAWDDLETTISTDPNFEPTESITLPAPKKEKLSIKMPQNDALRILKGMCDGYE